MRIFSAFVFLFPVFAQQATVSPDTVVLTVQGRQYTRAEFEEQVRSQNADPKDVATRIANADSLVRLQARAEDAKRLNLDKLPAVRMKIQIYELAMLNLALFNTVVEEIHKDESLARKRLESVHGVFEERHLRQLLIRHTGSKPSAGKLTPEQALTKIKTLRTKILGGANFADVAKAESEDNRTKSKGGDLGFIRKPLLVPEVGEVAFKLKVGEISEPIKSLDGFYLVLLEKIVPPAFEVVRKSLEYDLARERVAAMPIPDVQMNPDYFGKK